MRRRSLLQTMAAGICAGLAPSPLLGLSDELPANSDEVANDLTILRNARWSEEKAFEYMRKFGAVKGCNYVPGDGISAVTAPNSELIRRELGWAHEVVGLNSVRIWVELADFQINADRLGYLRTLRAFSTSVTRTISGSFLFYRCRVF